MLLEGKEFLDKGKRGFVYTAFLDGRKVLVKEKNPAAEVDTVAHEAAMTQRLNGLGIGPRFIAFEDDVLVREFVDGERIEDFLAHASAGEAKAMVREVLQQCHAMDVAGINKFEMTHPYKHILVTGEGRVVMIDFERCKFTHKPKNVTQFCQYVARIVPLLERCGLAVDGDEVKRLGEEYKRAGYDAQVFEQLSDKFSQ